MTANRGVIDPEEDVMADEKQRGRRDEDDESPDVEAHGLITDESVEEDDSGPARGRGISEEPEEDDPFRGRGRA
jgi:hypothetical protein